MNLIIDIGNTCVKLVCFDTNEVKDVRRIDKDDIAAFRAFTSKYCFSQGVYSSVSDVSSEIHTALMTLPYPMLEFQSGITKIPLKNKYKTPLTLGADRLAAAVGANGMNPGKNLLIIDVGTCVTFDFVSSDAEYLGGNISLGPTMRLKALHEYTSLLPLVERKGELLEIGNTTETAIRAGVLAGIKYEIEGYVNYFSTKYPQLFVYLTGGVRLDLQLSEKIPIFADDFIVPKGLNRILEYNNEFK